MFMTSTFRQPITSLAFDDVSLAQLDYVTPNSGKLVTEGRESEKREMGRSQITVNHIDGILDSNRLAAL